MVTLFHNDKYLRSANTSVQYLRNLGGSIYCYIDFEYNLNFFNRIMRKRRGALHTEDYQQLLVLSQRAESKLGIFYDENLNANNLVNTLKMTDKLAPTSKVQFTNFDFDRKDSRRLEQEKLDEKKWKTVNIMFVLKESQRMENIIKKCFQIEDHYSDTQPPLNCKNVKSGDRNVELLIKNKSISDSDETVYKIWLNFKPEIPIFQSYYRKLNKFWLITDSMTSEQVNSVRKAIQKVNPKSEITQLCFSYDQDLIRKIGEIYKRGQHRFA